MLGETGSKRIDTLVHDMVEHSARASDIVQGPRAGPAMDELRDFMFEHVYLGPAVRAERARIVNVVSRLFEHYAEHPELLPSGGGREEAAAPAHLGQAVTRPSGANWRSGSPTTWPA